MGFSQKLIKKSRISIRMVSFISYLILLNNQRRREKYLFACNTLGHSFYGGSASRNIGVIQFHATHHLHHRSRAKTNLPLLVCLSHSSNRSLSQSLHVSYRVISKFKTIFEMPLEVHSLQYEIDQVCILNFPLKIGSRVPSAERNIQTTCITIFDILFYL